VQRRLSAADVNDICATYVSGTSIDELARSHGVNRTTIIKRHAAMDTAIAALEKLRRSHDSSAA
jgi:transposase-like protein